MQLCVCDEVLGKQVINQSVSQSPLSPVHRSSRSEPRPHLPVGEGWRGVRVRVGAGAGAGVRARVEGYF